MLPNLIESLRCTFIPPFLEKWKPKRKTFFTNIWPIDRPVNISAQAAFVCAHVYLPSAAKGKWKTRKTKRKRKREEKQRKIVQLWSLTFDLPSHIQSCCLSLCVCVCFENKNNHNKLRAEIMMRVDDRFAGARNISRSWDKLNASPSSSTTTTFSPDTDGAESILKLSVGILLFKLILPSHTALTWCLFYCRISRKISLT